MTKKFKHLLSPFILIYNDSHFQLYLFKSWLSTPPNSKRSDNLWRFACGNVPFSNRYFQCELFFLIRLQYLSALKSSNFFFIFKEYHPHQWIESRLKVDFEWILIGFWFCIKIWNKSRDPGILWNPVPEWNSSEHRSNDIESFCWS